jgi:hypothetical protein
MTALNKADNAECWSCQVGLGTGSMEYGRQPGDDNCQAGLAANSVERWSKSAFDSGQGISSWRGRMLQLRVEYNSFSADSFQVTDINSSELPEVLVVADGLLKTAVR